MQEGTTRAEIDVEISKCAQPDAKRPVEDAAEALAVAEQALDSSNALFDADAQFLRRFLTVSALLSAVFRFIVIVPQVRVIVLAVTALRSLAEVRLTQVATQKAANDAALAIVRRAAANAARFRQTGT